MSWSNATLHKALRPDDMKDRRRHQRVRLSLSGRYMLSDHREYPCQTVDMSPGGVCIIAPVIGNIGSRVVIYLDHIGRLEGQIVRHVEGGFAAQLRVPPLKREKLADQLTWLANRHILGLPEDRRHERIEPVSKRAILTLPDGKEITVKIIDISLSGTAISIEAQPAIGTSVMIGRTKGVIIRHFPDGVAIEFLRQIPEDRFDPGIKL
jgi:hypothetical protein